jgi:two-component system response regulator RegX3
MEIQTTSALAQAMNWVHATRSLFSTYYSYEEQVHADAFNMIVADVSAGGISLVEYAIEQYAMVGLRPTIVLMDQHGDVSAARRAIRLSVDAYLLESDPTNFKLLALEQVILQAQSSQPPTRNLSVKNNSSPGGVTGFDGMGQMANLQTHTARLSTIENAIINCLNHSAGLPVSARAIVNTVMGRDLDEDKAASLLRPHISRLRSKLEPMPQMPQHLLTVRGKGYMVV